MADMPLGPPVIKDPDCKLCKGKTYDRLPCRADFPKQIDHMAYMEIAKNEYGRCSRCDGYYYYGKKPVVHAPQVHTERPPGDIATISKSRLRDAAFFLATNPSTDFTLFEAENVNVSRGDIVQELDRREKAGILF